MSHTGDTTLLRRVNASAVLELLRAEGPLARAEIGRRLRLSPATITRIVSGLIATGVVVEHSAGDSTGGRRPTLVELNARASLIVGVYVGGQTVAGALVDLHGSILRRHALPTVAGDKGVAQVIAVIRALLEQAEALGVPVSGVGVGAPSVVHYPTGVVALAPSLGWRDLPLQKVLQEAIGLPVIVENEVNLIALGEAWRGGGQGIDALVCLSLGAGIGAGIVLNGRLYRGAHHGAGEIGYMIPGEQFLGRIYDVYGCLEGLAGYDGIVQRARLRLAAAQNGARDSLLAGREISVDDVLAAARLQDPLACAVIDETVDYLTIALANLASVIDPQRVIISGELAAHGDLFLEPIRRRLVGLMPILPEVVLSELMLDAPILGAGITALRETSGAVEVLTSRA
jgi:glucokinase-like ROK family protein